MQLPDKSGIYCAIHRETGMCYVGSSTNIRRRKNQHIADVNRGRLCCFHRKMRELGPDSFDWEVLEECSSGALEEREKAWIAFLGAATAMGFNTQKEPYLNSLGYRHSYLTRLRMSLSRIGRKMPPRTPQHRMNISLALKKRTRKPHSELTKLKIGLAQKGKPRPPRTIESIIKQSISSRGRKLSEATKLKMRLAAKNRSPEHIAKIIASKKANAQKRNELHASTEAGTASQI